MKFREQEGLANHFYFDRDDNLDAVKLLPSEYYVASNPMVLSTVLGSCVSACAHMRCACV